MKTIPEQVAHLRSVSPAALAGLDDKAAAGLLRAAYAAVTQEIAKASDGVVKVGGLGMFRVRTVEPKEGAKGNGRRVLFRAAAPKAGKGGKGAKGAKGAAAQ
jgi:nucleoid DNA-binding protein